MQSRRIACLLLGLWLGASAWMAWVASENSAAADSLFLRPSPEAAKYLKSLGHTPLNPLAIYLAAEQNRALYDTWGVVQIALSATFFFLLLFGTRMGKFPLALALVLLAIALGERLFVIPEMAMVGRATDFTVDPSHRARLAASFLNEGYAMAEVAKWIVAAGVAALLIWQPGKRSLHSRQEVDLIDKANYRHIDR